MGQGTQGLPGECYGICLNPARVRFPINDILNEIKVLILLQFEVDVLTEQWSSSLPISFSLLDILPMTLSDGFQFQPRHVLPCSLCSLMGMRSLIFAIP